MNDTKGQLQLTRCSYLIIDFQGPRDNITSDVFVLVLPKIQF